MSESEKSKFNRYFAVTGRIPGRDEDSLRVYQVRSREEAIECFREDLWSDEPDHYHSDARERTFRAHGDDVFVNSIVVSDSPIVEI